MSTLDKPISRAPSTGLYFATRKGQDELRIYTMVIPMGILARDIARDFSPETPLEGNRIVNARRAEEYADYVIERHREGKPHITPPVVLRSSGDEVREDDKWLDEDAQGIARGALEIQPRVLRTADGQHRIYGARKKLEWYDDEIVEAKLLLEHAQANDQETAVIEQAEGRLERLREEHDALYRLPVTAEIIAVDSERVYQQLFADIANNAKGLGGDLTTWFDQTKVIYRIARALTEEGGDSLLVGKVHIGIGAEDRLPAEAPYWIGAKTVADVVHAVVKGVNGRFSRRDEKELEKDTEAERELSDSVKLFLKCLADVFPIVREIRDGKPSYGGAIRKSRTTMLTSSSMLRALAGAYYLTVQSDGSSLPGKTTEEKARAFSKGLRTLVEAMTVDPAVGVQRNNAIAKIAPDAFSFGGKSRPTAPMARMGNINTLARALAEHIQTVATA